MGTQVIVGTQVYLDLVVYQVTQGIVDIQDLVVYLGIAVFQDLVVSLVIQGIVDILVLVELVDTQDIAESQDIVVIADIQV